MLEVAGISASYGSVRALENVSVSVGADEIVCLLGSNGAGKTTLLNCISGIVSLQAGRVLFQGEPLHGQGVEKIVARGIVQVPEGREIFPSMSVLDNLMLGGWTQRHRKGWKAQADHVFELFPRLKERVEQMAGTLSGGEQQMLLIGRALMARPSLLMFDEPSLGLSPIMVQLVFEIIGRVHSEGIPILLVEQNARVALKTSSRGYILENGELRLQGSAQELATNPQVQAVYLGG